MEQRQNKTWMQPQGWKYEANSEVPGICILCEGHQMAIATVNFY